MAPSPPSARAKGNPCNIGTSWSETGVDLPNAKPRLEVPPISTSVSGGSNRCCNHLLAVRSGGYALSLALPALRTPSWLVVWARGGVHAPACQTWCGAVGPRAAIAPHLTTARSEERRVGDDGMSRVS